MIDHCSRIAFTARLATIIAITLCVVSCAQMMSAGGGMNTTSGAASAESPSVAAARYEQAVANAVRTDQDRKMDAARRPLEFLAFTQVAPGMQVLDVAAG